MKSRYKPADPPLVDNVNVYKSAKDKSEALADVFEKVSTTNNLPSESKNFRAKYEKTHPLCHPQSDNSENYNSIITIRDFNVALDNIKKVKVSEGIDQISYRMLREIPQSFKILIVELFNRCYSQGTVPSMWKHAIVTPIPKQGKPRKEVGSYRPISLTSHLGKIYERILKGRLEHFCESKGIIPLYQAGFRRGRGVTDHIVSLASHVKKALQKRRPLYACFFDIHRAFDTVWHHKLLEKIHKFGIKGNMYSFIQSFLKNRSFQVNWHGTLSSRRNIDTGVPQGSVISPLLFSIMLSDISTVDVKGAKITLYADDLAVWKEALFRRTGGSRGLNRLFKKTNNTFQKVIKNITTYMKHNGFTLSPNKTKFIVFTRNRLVHPIQMNVLNTIIRPSKEVRYLGVIFSSNGRWGSHIQSLIANATKAINLLRILKRQPWSSHPKIMTKLAVTLVRSRLLFGMEAAFSASPSLIKKLMVIDAKAIKISLGLPKATPHYLTYREAGILPYNHQMRLQCANYLFRHKTVSNSTNIEELERETNYRNAPKKSLLKDFTRPLLTQANLDVHEVATIPLHPYPPWTLERPVIFSSIPGVDKSYPLLANILTREHIESLYNHSLHIYTDGSVNNSTVGAAFTIPDLNVEKRYNLSQVNIFTAELLAISMALEFINDMPVTPRSIVILTDSQSSLATLSNDNRSTREDIVKEIGVLIHQIKLKGTEVILQWIPSHIGIPGNETADRLAREAANNIAANRINLKMSYSDVKCRLKMAAWKLWQDEFLATAEQRGYDIDLSPPTKHGMFIPNTPSNITSMIHRLRCDVWKTIFVPKGCECGSFISPHHIIFKCPINKNVFENLLKSTNGNTLKDLMQKHPVFGWSKAIQTARLIAQTSASYCI